VTSDLGINATEQLWVIDVYGFMITGFLITMGKLVDRVGRRKVLLVVPPAAASAAGESLAGATAAADPLPAPVADALLDAARAAFTSGFNVVAGIAAVAFAGLAVLATAGLRYTPAIGAGSSRGPLPGRYASLGIRRQTRMVGAGRC
jgi:MFS transporter, DHA2 family, multidrug resistance protein